MWSWCCSLDDCLCVALSKGASVVNAAEGGGELHGALMRPAIVYPVTSDMRLWNEEQFGPVIPIAVYETAEQLYEYLGTTPYGQQAALFTTHADAASAGMVDVLSTVVGRINLNTQCGRSPDSLPFSGRRSSAQGTMSVTEALRAFSVEVVVAGKANAQNEALLKGLESTSKFMQPLEKEGVKSDL